MKQATMIVIASIIVSVVVGFFAGVKYQQTKQPSFAFQGRFPGQNGTGQNGAQRPSGNMRNGGGQIIGTILSMDASSITVKLADGSSKIILLTSSTTYAKEAEGAKTDLKVGDRVGGFGTTNQDGSITAQSIQINPMQRRMGDISPTPNK